MTAQIFDLAKYQSKKAVTQSEEMIKAANEIYESIFPSGIVAEGDFGLSDTAPSEYSAPPQDSA